MPERIQILEIRETDAGHEFLVPSARGGQAWVDILSIAQDILNEEYSFFILNELGHEETFHVVLQRDGSWNIDHYPESEAAPDDVVLMEA